MEIVGFHVDFRLASFLNPIVTAARLTPSLLATSALDSPLFTNAAQRSHRAGPDPLLTRSPDGL